MIFFIPHLVAMSFHHLFEQVKEHHELSNTVVAQLAIRFINFV